MSNWELIIHFEQMDHVHLCCHFNGILIMWPCVSPCLVGVEFKCDIIKLYFFFISLLSSELSATALIGRRWTYKREDGNSWGLSSISASRRLRHDRVNFTPLRHVYLLQVATQSSSELFLANVEDFSYS
ncbi:hypothetical protein SAY86_031896 [Trapa natans]|uniref:Uncharacterized protein n=1 Tax=Trapa natans TaxID=22666 RepID=A0AAN7M4H0_TRANT|nr:hypothetical protein SAY86_031896 [Trapa natans]